MWDVGCILLPEAGIEKGVIFLPLHHFLEDTVYAGICTSMLGHVKFLVMVKFLHFNHFG